MVKMKKGTKTETKKKRLSDESFRDILFSELNQGNEKAHLRTNFYELLSTKSSIAKSRALKLHGIYYSEWSKIKENATTDAMQVEVANSVKSGIKSKDERILILQIESEKILSELENGKFKETSKVGNKIQTFDRLLTPAEKATMRKTYRDLQAEISKMQGDYAETKMKHSGDVENPILSKVEIEVIHSGTRIAKSEEEVDV